MFGSSKLLRLSQGTVAFRKRLEEAEELKHLELVRDTGEKNARLTA